MIGELAGLGCGAGWAVVSIVLRALSVKVSPVVVNGLRCTVAAIVLVVAVLALGRGGEFASLPVQGVALIVASGFLGQGLGDLTFLKSMTMIGAARAMPISNVNPLMTVGLAMLFLGEHLSWLGVAGAFLVIAGVFCLAFPYGSVAQMSRSLGQADRGGVLLALLAAMLWASSTIMLKIGLANIDLVVANLFRMATATVLLFAIEAVRSGVRVPSGVDRRFLLVVALAGSFSALTSLSFLTAVSFAGAAKASILAATSPLFALPMSTFFLKERITPRVVAGTLLCVAGIWLVLGG